MDHVLDYLRKKKTDRKCISVELLSYFGIFDHSCDKNPRRKMCKKCVKNRAEGALWDSYISAEDCITLRGDYDYYDKHHRCTFINPNGNRCLHPQMTQKEQRCKYHHCNFCFDMDDKKIYLAFLSVPYAKRMPKDIKIMIYHLYKNKRYGIHQFAYKEGEDYILRHKSCPNKAQLCNMKKSLTNFKSCEVYGNFSVGSCRCCNEMMKHKEEKRIFDENRKFIHNYVFETMRKIDSTNPYFEYILGYLFTDSTKITLKGLNEKLGECLASEEHVKKIITFLADKINVMAKMELDASHARLIDYRYKTIFHNVIPQQLTPFLEHILV
jgi:hypothetical protein